MSQSNLLLTAAPDRCEGGGEGDEVHGGHRAEPEVQLRAAPRRRHDGQPDEEVVVQRGEVSDGEVALPEYERARVDQSINSFISLIKACSSYQPVTYKGEKSIQILRRLGSNQFGEFRGGQILQLTSVKASQGTFPC